MLNFFSTVFSTKTSPQSEKKFHHEVNEICFTIKNYETRKVLVLPSFEAGTEKARGGLAIR